MWRHFKNSLWKILNSSNAIIFPGQFGYALSDYEGVWMESSLLNLTFDDILLNGADVETAFMDGQSYLESYRECAMPIPRLQNRESISNEEAIAHYRQYTDCAIALRPELRETFSFYYED